MKPIYIQLGVSIVVFILAIGFYVFMYTQVQSQSAQAAQLAQEIKDKSQANTRIAQAKEQLAALAPQQAAINQYFVSPNDIVPFLEQFTSTGKFFGATVQVVSVSANPGTPYGTLSLALKISGSFEAVMRTLGSIEYGPYDITTNSVSLDSVVPDSTTKNPITWNAAVMLTIGTQSPAVTP